MEAIVAEPPQDGQDPKTPTQAVAQVLPKSNFLENVGMRDAALKKSAKPAAVNVHVQELESELHAEKQGSAKLRVKLDVLEKKFQDQEDAARKQEEETEKLKKQGSEIQGFLWSFTSLFGGNFAPSPGPQ